MSVAAATGHASKRIAAALILCLTSAVARAADIGDFYRGKQIRIVVGSDAGGGYDAYARLIATHLGNFIPGSPGFVVQNMPGAGSLIALNYVANVAPKDGTIIAAINPTAITIQLYHPEQAKYDARSLNWLGAPVTITYIAGAWHTAPVQSIQDLFQKELIVGSAGGASLALPLLANGIIKTKFKVIQGYKSAGAAMLAMEKGESQGNGGDALNNLKAVHSDLLRDGKLRIILSYGLKPNAELPGVPLAIDFAQTDRQKQALRFALANQDIGWPYVMAAGVPDERVEAVRSAFSAMVKDPAFLADAKARKLDISPASAADQAALTRTILDTPPDVVEEVKRIVGE